MRAPSFTVTPSRSRQRAPRLSVKRRESPLESPRSRMAPAILALHRLEHRVELRHRARVEDLLLLAVLGEERHLLHARLELGRVAIEIERPLRDGVVLDSFRARQLVQHPLAVLAEAELDERIPPRPRCRALAQEAESPRVQVRIGAEPHADGGFVTAQRAEEHGRRARRGPGEGVARAR